MVSLNTVGISNVGAYTDNKLAPSNSFMCSARGVKPLNIDSSNSGKYIDSGFEAIAFTGVEFLESFDKDSSIIKFNKELNLTETDSVAIYIDYSITASLQGGSSAARYMRPYIIDVETGEDIYSNLGFIAFDKNNAATYQARFVGSTSTSLKPNAFPNKNIGIAFRFNMQDGDIIENFCANITVA